MALSHSSLACVFSVLAVAAGAAAQQFAALRQSPLLGEVPLVPSGGIAADVDGDGAIDVLLRSGAVLFGDGHLGFAYSPPGDHIPGPAPGLGTQFQLAADLDQDGDLDLVRTASLFTTALVTQVRVMPGLPAGYFGAETTVATVPGVATAAAARDVDGDGRIDLVLRGATAAAAPFLLHNDGNGAFSDVSATALVGVVGVPSAFADVDGDGDVDFVTAAYGPLQLCTNNGNGTFAPAIGSGLPTLANTAVAALADADADGDADLVLGVGAAQALQLFTNGGNGVFTLAAATLPVQGRVLRVVDLDGDARADLVSVVDGPLGAADAELRVWHNLGAAGFVLRPPVPIDRGAVFTEPQVADFDGDGDRDVVLDGTTFFVNDGALAFTPLQRDAGPFGMTDACVLVGDFDGDGFDDVAAGRRVLQNRGDGVLLRGAPLVPVAGRLRACGDLDGDGDLDLVWTTDGGLGGPCGWLQNQGGAFVAVPLPNGALAGAVVIADFDGDGAPDLLSGATRFLRNVGGAFQAVGNLLSSVDTATRIVAGDLDGDGDLDVVGDSFGSSVGVCRNLGGFAFVSTNLTSVFDPSVALGDVDLDGDLDLAVGSRNVVAGGAVGAVQVFSNNGNGQFVAGVVMTTGTSAPAVLLVDVTEDGVVDLVAGRVFANVPGTGFVATPDAVPARGVAAADVDRDGDVDLVVDDGERIVVQQNRRRHLATPRVPVLGQPYVVAMAARTGGAGGAFVQPFLSFVRLPVPVALPGLGLLQVDALTALPGPVLATAADGSASLPLVLPALPTLAGLPFGWQGLVLDGGTLRLTGCVQDVLVR